MNANDIAKQKEKELAHLKKALKKVSKKDDKKAASKILDQMNRVVKVTNQILGGES